MRRLSTMFCLLAILGLGPPAALGMSTEIANDVAFRAQFGLRHDLGWVSAVRARQNANTAIYGVALLSSETKELDRRDQIPERIDALRSYVREHRTTYAGMYIDQAAGGTLVVRFTGDPGASAASVRALVPVDIDVVTTTADYSLADLDAVVARLDQDRDKLAKDGIVIWWYGVSQRQNRIELGLDPSSKGREGDLVAQYGDLFAIEASAGVAGATCTSRGSCTPMRAGIKGFNGSGAAICTLGFLAEDTSGYDYMITAAHCGGVDQGWWHPSNNYFGRVLRWNYGGSADAMGIVFQTATTRTEAIYVHDGEMAGSVMTIQSLTGDFEGQAVCKSGITTGRTCGQVEETDLHVIQDGHHIYHMRLATIQEKPGDSGAPVFYCGLSGCDARGITSGNPLNPDGTRDTTRATYSHIRNVMSELDLRVCTENSPC